MFNKKLFLTLWLVKATVVWMAWLVMWSWPADAQELVCEQSLFATPEETEDHLETEYYYDLETSNLKVQKSFQDYTVRIYDSLGDTIGIGAFEILRNGRRVYIQEGAQLSIDSYKGESLMGKDITGDGAPDLVVRDYWGGAHGPTNFYVFEIGKEFREIDTIEDADGGGHFADFDGDSNLEFVMYDGWNYWREYSNADSPYTTVIFRFRDGAYRLASDLMRKPAPDFTELLTRAQEIRNLGQQAEDWYFMGLPPPSLWRFMLNLIYSGQPRLAWQFFDMAWPPDRPGKDEMLKNFRAMISEGLNWPEIEALSTEQTSRYTSFELKVKQHPYDFSPGESLSIDIEAKNVSDQTFTNGDITVSFKGECVCEVVTHNATAIKQLPKGSKIFSVEKQQSIPSDDEIVQALKDNWRPQQAVHLQLKITTSSTSPLTMLIRVAAKLKGRKELIFEPTSGAKDQQGIYADSFPILMMSTLDFVLLPNGEVHEYIITQGDISSQLLFKLSPETTKQTPRLLGVFDFDSDGTEEVFLEWLEGKDQEIHHYQIYHKQVTGEYALLGEFELEGACFKFAQKLVDCT